MRWHLKTFGLAATLWLLTTQLEAQAAARSETAQPEPARPGTVEHPWWIAAEVHLSILSNLVDKSTINLTFGYAAKFGYRWKTGWGAYFQAEHNMWTETEIDISVLQGAFNIGIGAERSFFRDRMRTALAVGPSVLLYETALDNPGTTGLFIDLRPTGVRWPVGKGYVLVLDPLTFTIVAPALGGIPLVQIQYRTAFSVEYGLVR